MFLEKLNISREKKLGFGIGGLFIIGFCLWAALVPLDSASIAFGKVVVSTHHKDIQSLDGGKVLQVLVKDGQEVKEGERLIIFDTRQDEITRNYYEQQYAVLNALEERLIAEKSDRPSFELPDDLLQSLQALALEDVVALQIELFLANQKARRSKIEILKERIVNFESLISDYKREMATVDTQLSLIQKELGSVIQLEKEQLVGRPRLLALQREEARLLGTKEEIVVQMGRIEQQLSESELEIVATRREYKKQVLDEINTTKQKALDVKQRLQAITLKLQNANIVSPTSGIIQDLKVHAPGAVVRPGEVMMTVVPKDDPLIVEAYANPLDIDTLAYGQKARVMLLPYKQRSLFSMEGVVTNISPDLVRNEFRRQEYYLVTVVIPHSELTKQSYKVIMYPGMPVEVMIISGQRTPFYYLFSPIIESFDRAFKEK